MTEYLTPAAKRILAEKRRRIQWYRRRVLDGRLTQTPGGLKAHHLRKDPKTGRIKSIKASKTAKKRLRDPKYKKLRELFHAHQIPKGHRRAGSKRPRSRRHRSKK